MNRSYLLDLGSHSVKLYRRDDDEELLLLRTVTWRVLETAVEPENLAAILQSVLAEVDDFRTVQAVATAAFRRDVRLGAAITRLCEGLGISLEIIDQRAEALLLRAAVSSSGSGGDLDAINVGGGSIQIISGDGSEHLLPFGISDLNKRFGLAGPVSERRVQECQDFVVGELPAWLDEFWYTGGERTYLEHFGVPLSGLWCARSDFEPFADDLATWTGDRLRSRSPYDDGWMTGAVASNCIVLAGLKRNDLNKFAPADLNISHGVHKSAVPVT